MYRCILVPLDGSPFGESALPLALRIAQRAGAELHLAHVHVLPAPLFAESRPNVENTLNPHARRRARHYLEDVTGRLRAAARVPVVPALLEGGIADALLEHAAAAGADLLVLTTHGRGPLSRFWVGSVADELVRRATLPLLLLRPQEEAPDFTAPPEIKKILIPLDGSARSASILEPATRLGALLGAEFILLRAVEPVLLAGPPPNEVGLAGFNGPMLERMEEEARAYLERTAAPLRARSLPVRIRVAVGQPAPLAILEEAQGRKVDLIAMATRGRRGLARFFLGSVADKVVRAARTPVLVLHPPQ